MNPPGEAPGGYIALDMNKLQRGTMFFEGFRGWGFEDTQFLYSVIQKYGIPSRV